MTDRQVPLGSEKLVCPLHKETMDKVCHKCPFWVHLRCMNPQNADEMIDRWNCAIAFMPVLLTENARQQMETAKELGRFRAQMVQLSLNPIPISPEGAMLARLSGKEK